MCGAEGGKVMAGSHENQTQSGESCHDKEALSSTPDVQNFR